MKNARLSAMLLLLSCALVSAEPAQEHAFLNYFKASWGDVFSPLPRDSLARMQARVDALEGLLKTLPDGVDKETLRQVMTDNRAMLSVFTRSLDEGGYDMSPFRFIDEKCELKRDQIAEFMKRDASLTTEGVPLRDGRVIKFDSVTMLSPSGLRWIGEKIEQVPWPEIDPALTRLFGWTPDIQRRYEAWKENEITKSSVRLAQEKKRILEAERKGSTSTAPAVMESSQVFRENIEAAIDARARKNWPQDYSMQDYVRKSQRAAVDKIRGYMASGAIGVPNDVMAGIILRASQKWGSDYSMVVYDIENEVKAFRR